ncbi:nucleoside hydrolase [Actinopolyspora mortivallis]|uniref:nucleoside hydrolase n=1 Tax=Actinopolyspora mortivallis TaxID=33906 RepID=UPI00035F340B|nr:nucleoside hydrolase [Actinopolyspora mortivallis]
MKRILLDCDPGIDDALAIALAHGSPELEVVGLTTVAGNVGIEHTTPNALRLAEFYGMDVPVAAGAQRPLVRPRHTASTVHGSTGLGDVVLPEAKRQPHPEHAVDYIVDTVSASPGEISLVAVGPLTNIALALRKEPRITEWVREFVIMGGSYTRGNVTPAAEFNIGADPEAASVVFEAPWRTVVFGLDLTHQARASAEVRERFTGLGRLQHELLAPCLDFYGSNRQYRELGPAIHDACAVAYVISPELFTLLEARIDVETSGRFTSGMTVTDFASEETNNAVVATALDQRGFWDLVTDAFERVARTMPADPAA